MSQRIRQLLRIVCWLIVVIPLLEVIFLLATLPNVERAILMVFIPPFLACLFLLANNGKFNSTLVLGCRLFLGIISIAVFFGRHRLLLPNLKPQIPGMPVAADRILVFYGIGYGLFLWILCPAYVFGSSFYRLWRRLPGGMSRPILFAGSVCWLLTIGTLAVVIATSDKFF